MSYILEAIKNAENKRGNQRLSRSAINSHFVKAQNKKSIPWLAIAISFNAIIFLVWISYQLFSQETKTTGAVPAEDIKANVIAQAKVPNSVAATPIVSQPAEKNLAKNNQLQSVVGEVHAEQSAEVAGSASGKASDEIYDNTFDEEYSDVAKEQVRQADAQAARDERKQSSQEVRSDHSRSAFFTAKKQQTLNRPRATAIAPAETSIEHAVPIRAAIIEPVQVPQQVSQQVLLADKKVELPVARARVDTAPNPRVEKSKTIPVLRYKNVPRFDQLSYARQQQIPELTISVHIYNAEPAARKARVNGRLMYEGEQLNPSTTIAEITPRGVVFDYSGTLFVKKLH